MAQNPNLPPPIPGSGPAPANVILPPQPGEEAPDLNTPMTFEQHTADIAETDHLTELLRKHNQRRNIFDDHVGRGSYPDQATQDAAEQGLNAEWAGLQQSFADLASRGDTSVILQRLESHARSSREAFDHRTRVAARIGDTGAVDRFGRNADSARHTGLASLNRARDAAMTLSRETVPPLPPNPTAADVAAREQLLENRRIRQTAMSGEQHAAARDTVAATKAAQSRDRIDQNTQLIEGFDQRLTNIADGLINRHEANRLRISDPLDDATRSMRTWSLHGPESYAGQADTLHFELRMISHALNNPNILGLHDSARAELVADYNRLRYRLEARGINHADPLWHQNPGYDGPVYTSDGGILVNQNTPDAVILYQNGDSRRMGDDRRNAGGHAVESPVLDLATPVDLPAGVTTDRLVAQWEETRLPEDARDAHAGLMRDINILQTRDTDLGTEATRLSESLRANADAIAAIGTPSNPQEQADLTRLRSEQTRLTAEATRVRDDRRAVRERLNPAQYLRSFIELGANMPEEPDGMGARARRLGGRLLGQTVESDVPSAPEIYRDGSIVRHNFTLNGARGTWRIYADGRSVRVVRNASGTLVNQRRHSDGSIA